jgi:hypothetical protein
VIGTALLAPIIRKELTDAEEEAAPILQPRSTRSSSGAGVQRTSAMRHSQAPSNGAANGSNGYQSVAMNEMKAPIIVST